MLANSTTTACLLHNPSPAFLCAEVRVCSHVSVCLCVTERERGREGGREAGRRVPAITAPFCLSRTQQSSLSGHKDAPHLTSPEKRTGLRSFRHEERMRSQQAARTGGKI